MIPYRWFQQAAERIAPYIQNTPLTYDHENNFYLKWENHQATGSFKIRGALNKVLSLQPWERERGLVTASAGNHGQGVAYAGKLAGDEVIVFASDHAVPTKIEAMRKLGADVRLVSGGYGEAEAAGRAFAAQQGATWISPYNDGQVIAGQGTLALEVLQAHPELVRATWIVPGGGGGLISGIGAVLKEKPDSPSHPFPTMEGGTGGLGSPTLIGVQSKASPFLYDLFHTGRQDHSVELPSLADGLSGPVEAGSVTIHLTRQYVDDFILVSEKSIAQAIATAWERFHERIEGSAATALAAALEDAKPSQPTVVVISGGNIQPELHKKLLAEGSK